MNRSGKILLVSVLGVFALFAWLMSVNFHVIDPGKAYRSSQLAPWELEAVAKIYGIKTIINLRGVEKLPWFGEEAAVAKKMGMDMISIDMSSRTIPDRDAELKLIDAFEHAPKPLIIHCWSGSDRTGEAAAIYQMVMQKKSKKDAVKMLGPRYLHFKYFRPAKDYFVQIFKGLKWLDSSYFPCNGKFRYYNPTNSACREPSSTANSTGT